MDRVSQPSALGFFFGYMFDDFTKCESPIEAVFQLALASASRARYLAFCTASTLEELKAWEIWPGSVVVGSQVWADKVRLDFAMAYLPDIGRPIKILAVECDGMKHHHGSAEGVLKDGARDTVLNDLGIEVIRLTGAVIRHAPIASVNKCLVKIGARPAPSYTKELSDDHLRLADMMRKDELTRAAQAVTNPTGLKAVVSRRSDKAALLAALEAREQKT